MIARDEICALKENINKSGILNAALLSITSLVFNQVFHQESGVTCPTTLFITNLAHTFFPLLFAFRTLFDIPF